MVKIVDEIMGSGKTQGVMTMVGRLQKPVMFITPFLSECDRFAAGCERRTFVQPDTETCQRKIDHLRELVARSADIVSTHAMFRSFTADIMEMVRERGYVLIMDETCDVVSDVWVTKTEIDMLVRAGIIEEVVENGVVMYSFVGPESYLTNRHRMSEFCRAASVKNVFRAEGSTDGFLCSSVPVHLLAGFDDVYILTYMFDSYDMSLLFRMHNIEWQRAYVKLVDYGNGYDITDEPQPVQEYVHAIPDLVHVHSDDDVRYAGDGSKRGRRHAEINWYGREYGGVEKRTWFKTTVSWFRNKNNARYIKRLKDNFRLYFQYVFKEYGGGYDDVLWSTYKESMDMLSSTKYRDAFLPFNARATNEYADRRYLIYAVDIHVDPPKKKFFEAFGFEYPEDEYALSTMIQWIWRSRVRKGEEVWIYVPSKRMRDMLTEYLEGLR